MKDSTRIYLASTIGLLLAAMFGINAILDSGILEPFHVFSPEKLHALSISSIQQHGNDTKALVASIVEQLRADESTSPYISVDEQWMFNNAGERWERCITEYLIIFGTPLGTEGHTGRHTADDYFHIIQGTQMAFLPGSFEPEVYPQGSVHHLRRGDVKQYKMEASCFALEYAVGFIPGMFAFGYADGLSSTMDLSTLWQMTYVTGREMIGNLMKGKL